ncbi:alpha-amylase family protein [Glaciihabitans sp. dw_435]|uniref:alpha-amylase family protein n=1 Tax=Glaciihabitans sp. dw_435 TaxID=2720081 RepID=UPI001BD32086|nr:alpha-amylase family protein [Glaciihabitans sp. dw_435]
MPEWTEHVMWWHVYPLGFVGADTTGQDRTPTHRLAGLEGWLDYLLRLGVNGLALGPIFESGTHGYDTTDYFRIDARLGDTTDFEHLIAEAHARGIRVLLDGVFNHVGRDFAPLRAALADADAPDNALFVRDASGRLANFEGHDALVALNHDNPAVVDYVVSVMNHWLERGADGWRLDAAYSVPVGFWARVLPRVRESHPDVYIVGEVLHGDYPGIVASSTMDSATQYELWQAIWHGIAEANFFEIDWALQRHTEFLETFVPYTFVGNHDVTRIASQIADERHRAHALVLLFTLGGTPSVYYGDELGMTGIKEQRAGGDDAVRPAFPSDPAEVSPDDNPVFRLHQELIGLRRRHAWLHAATSRQLALTNETYVYEMTAPGGPETRRLVVALNLGDAPLAVEASTALVSEVLAGTAGIEGTITVPAHGWAVLA